MRIRPQTREWFAPILTAHTVAGAPISVPVTGWEATFDNRVTWLPSRDTGDGQPGWLIAHPDYPGPGDTDGGIHTDHIVTTRIAVYIRLRDSPETTEVGPFVLSPTL